MSLNKYINNLTVTDLEELNYLDYENFSISDLENLFEKISLTIEVLEIKKDDLVFKDLDSSDIEDNIYNLEQLQYEVQTLIEFKEV